MSIFYYDDCKCELISLPNVISNFNLPSSVRELSQHIYFFLLETEKKQNYWSFLSRTPSDRILVYDHDKSQKIIIYFCKTINYRRGTIYLAIQVARGWPSKKINITPKVYSTDIIHHSAASFGTTPGIDHCKTALFQFLADPEFNCFKETALYTFKHS